ncbi:MAG: hypothetical protein IT290_05585 [Deltaproteobacteria bacterium]|nr:hypothetical protein [Deltaproteobacteria bacterium]
MSVHQSTETSRQLLEGAKSQAQRLLEEAKASIEKERAQARHFGRQEGKKDAAHLIIEAQSLRRRLLEEARKDALDIIFAVAEEVVGQSIATDRSSILKRIEKAFGYVANARRIIFIVNPDDAPVVREAITDLAQRAGFLGEFIVRGDPGVRSGSARLETDVSVVEASIDVHLRALQEHFDSLSATHLRDHGPDENGQPH